MMKRLLYLFLLIGMITGLAACSEDDVNDEAEEERIVSVETAEVTEEDFVLERTIYGRTSPSTTTPVSLPQPGEVTELHAANGDQVEDGETLAVLSTAQGNITITAPTDGEVTGLRATEGGLVTNEEPFAMIADTDTMLLDFSVTANVQQLLSRDDTYTAIIDEEEFEATITQLDSMPDDTGLYPVQASVENPDETILTGMVTSLNVREQVIEDARTVPTAAVNYQDDEAYVFVIVDGQAEQRSITVQETGSETSAVEGDIEPGGHVVISGQLTLSDGDQVDVQKGE